MQIPEGWEIWKIGETLESCTYGTSTSCSLDPSNGVPVLRMGNIQNDRLDLNSLKYARVEPELMLRIGDILFNRTNSYDLVGKVAHCETSRPLSFASYLLRLRTHKHVDSKWLSYQLSAPDFRTKIKAIATLGVSQANINPTLLRAQKILLPPLAEQRKIAAILSSVDDAIAATQAVIEQTRLVKKGLLQELMTRGIGHTKFKQTEVGEIPVGWGVEKIQNLGLVDCGKAKDKKQNSPLRPYLRVANVLDGEINPNGVMKMPFSDKEFERFKLEVGDILLNEGQSLNLVGRPAVYQGNPPNVAMQNALIRWRPDPIHIESDFGYQVIRWLYRSGIFSQISTQTTSIAHLGLKRFAGVVIALPPLAEQRRIASTLSGLDEAIRVNKKQIGTLQQTKKGLLQDLLTGKVRVSL